MKYLYIAALSILMATSAQATEVFINEIHYDNTGGDVDEFFEVAAPVGTDLTNWSVELYNGSNGTVYNTVPLSDGSTTQDETTMFVTVNLPSNGLQNGSPDGLALIDNSGVVIQFLSYEGSLVGTNGTAVGLTSDDIGVSESSSTPLGESLQLSGTGSVYADFEWQAPQSNTAGLANTDQTFAEGGDLSGLVFFNEIHYDNAGGDVDEFIEVVAPLNADLTAWSIELYNGSNGTVYNTLLLTDGNATQDANTMFVEFSLPTNGLQNGSPDGMALIDDSGEVIQFLSYEGEMTATSGSAIGLTSEDIGVSETSSTPAGESLQLAGTGTMYSDFEWQAPQSNTKGAVNIGQTFSEDVVIGEVTFLNEFHYDNAGSDVGEFIEIASPIGTDLSGWSVELYNGNAGTVYNTIMLPSGTTTNDATTMFVSLEFPSNGLQNGAPDGLALIDNLGNVIQFLSYEGAMVASDGSAVGLTSEDIGVSETSSTAVGDSLQLAGIGTVYSDFTWQAPQNNTMGAVNIGQSFASVTGAPFVVDFSPLDNATDVAIDTTLSITFNENVLVSQWPSLSCTISGSVNLSGNLSGSQFTLTPAASLSANETCTFTLPANSVVDTDDTADPLASDYVSSFTTTEPFVCTPEGGHTFISQVQGSGDTSSMEGQTVTIQGIVTGLRSDSSSFFVQEEDADADADPSTSEGIFVFNDNSDYTPVMGDLVTVRGVVSEFFNLTQITVSTSPLVCGSGSVTPSVISLPFNANDNLETLEGMLVTSATPLTVTNTFEMGRYGEVQLSNGLLFNPNNVFLPGSAENEALRTANSFNRVKMDDGSDEQNPLVVPFPTGGLSAGNTLRLGDTVASLIGVMDYRFGEYLIVPNQEPTFVASNPRTSGPELNLGNLKVASLNVLNFFNTIDSGASICGPNSNQSCRGADDNGTDGSGRNELERQTLKTIAAITALDADIVGLMEIENDGFGVDSSIVELVAGINAVMGPDTYSIVEAAGPIGSDAIVVALIYKPSVVSLVGGPQILDSSNSIVDENGPLFDDGRNRPSLIQKFALVENGEEIVLSVNHLKSKGSSCGAGDDDATTGQGNCNLTRTRAAQALVAFLDTQFGDTPTLIIGDLNAYALEDPITTITTGAGYTDLANLFGGSGAYSYSFSGELGYLDHALASASLLDKVVDTTEWRINADEPIVLDYNLNFKKVEQYDTFFAPDAYRMSDHDPVVVSIQLDSDVLIGDVDGNGRLEYADFFLIIRARGAVVGDRRYIEAADLNNDGVINRADSNAWRVLYRAAR